jgi:hypothetical protein
MILYLGIKKERILFVLQSIFRIFAPKFKDYEPSIENIAL